MKKYDREVNVFERKERNEREVIHCLRGMMAKD